MQLYLVLVLYSGNRHVVTRRHMASYDVICPDALKNLKIFFFLN